MPGCPTYSSPRHEAVPNAGDITGLLEVDKRILVFFEKRETADAFSIAAAEDPIIHNCAVYHSHLPTTGTNSKAYNLSLWDSGRSQVMAATAAAGQGIDRPHVKFVIIHGHTYGMTSYIQQGGHGGRGGHPSYVILLRDPCILRQTHPGKEGDLDVNCVSPFLKYTANKNVCWRKMLLNTMDGEAQSVGCRDLPRCNPCNICDPDSDMLRDILLHPWSYLGARALLYFYSASMCTTGPLTVPTGLTRQLPLSRYLAVTS